MPREMPVAWSNLLDALKSWQAPYYESRAQALQKAKMEGDWRMEGARLSEQRRASMAQEDIQRDTLAETSRHHRAQEANWEADMALRTRVQEWAEHMDRLAHSLQLATFWQNQRLALAEESRTQKRFEWEEEDRPQEKRLLEAQVLSEERNAEYQRLQNEFQEGLNRMQKITERFHEDMTQAELDKILEEANNLAARSAEARARAWALLQGLNQEGEAGMPRWEQIITDPKFSEAVDRAYQQALSQSGYGTADPRGSRGWQDAYDKYIGSLTGIGITGGHPTLQEFRRRWEDGSLPAYTRARMFEFQARRHGIWEDIPQGSDYLSLWMDVPALTGSGATGEIPDDPTLRERLEELDDSIFGEGSVIEKLKNVTPNKGFLKEGLKKTKEKLKEFFKNRKSQGGPGAAEGADSGVFSDDFLEDYRYLPKELGYPVPPTVPPYGPMPQESAGGQFGQQFLERQVTPLGGGAVNPDAIQQHRQSTPQKQGPAPPSVPPYGQMPEQQQPPGGQVNPNVLDRFFNRPPQGSVNPNAIQRGGYQPPSPWQAPRPNPSDMQPMQPPRGQFNQQTFDRFKRTTPLGGQVNPDAIQTERYRPPESFQPYRPNPASIESMQRPEQQGQFGRDFMNVQRTPQGSVNPEAVGRYRQGYQPPESYQPPRPAASQYSPMKREGPRTRSQPEVKSAPQTAEQAPREEPRPPVVDQRGPYVEQPPEVIDRTEQDTRGPATVQPEEERGFLGRIGEKVKGAIGDIFNLDNTEEQIVEYEGDVYVVKKDGRVFTVDGQEVTQESFKSNIIRKMMKDQEKAKEAETQQKQQQRRFMGIERR